MDRVEGLRLEIRDRTRRLQELLLQERGLGEARKSLAAARASLAEAEERLGPDAGIQERPERLGEPLLEALATAVDGVRAARAVEGDLRQRLRTLDARLQGGGDHGAPTDASQDDLVGAIKDLREWLRSSDGEARERGQAPRALAVALLVAGVLALVAAVAFDQPWLSAGLILGGVVDFIKRWLGDIQSPLRNDVTHKLIEES